MKRVVMAGRLTTERTHLGLVVEARTTITADGEPQQLWSRAIAHREELPYVREAALAGVMSKVMPDDFVPQVGETVRVRYRDYDCRVEAVYGSLATLTRPSGYPGVRPAFPAFVSDLRRTGKR